ncbi:hypothetical protein VTN00DRAFT_9739 [Thermoascus crustaceus]|uniref:uncharacterized protein n=1 Tax=Thermoascus crustaceus TaxID=5088 RepID=UPI0037427B04
MEIQEKNPLLTKAFHLDHGKTRRLPVEFAGSTWDDDIISFREALINVERYWGELGGEGPIHFSEDDLKIHLHDAERSHEVQDFFDSIDGLVKRDGWTHNETYDEALDFFSRLRKVGLREMKGKEREKFERVTPWAER